MASSLGLPRFVLFYTSFDKYLCQTSPYIAGSLRCSGDDVTSPAIKLELEMAKTDDGDQGSLYNIRSKYLCQTNQYVAGSLRCSGVDVTSPAIKFEMEMAKTDDGDGGSLFNIRSCHNNKYWMAESPSSLYMTAAADKPNEDSSQWSCTLFEAVHVEPDAGSNNNNLIIRLRFVHNQKPVSVQNGSPDHYQALYPEGDVGYSSKFNVIDAESLLILPKTVAFKASNGKYLEVYSGRVRAFATDIGAPYATFGITYNTTDGYAGITCKENNMVVSCEHETTYGYDCLVPLENPPSLHYKNALFEIIKVAGPKKDKDGKMVGSTTVALRCVANNRFLRCDDRTDGNIYADNISTSITHGAVFTIEEPLLSRTIYNVNFRTADSRIYGDTILSLASKDVSNFNSEPQVEHLKFNYKKTSSSTFDRAVSLSVGVETTFKTGIPFIADGEIDISVEAEGSLGWSDTDETSQEIESSQDVTVAPMTRIVASMVATQGKCDAPFSYTQRDILFDGSEVITEMDDGTYKGVSCWNFHCVTTSPEPFLLPKP